MQLTFFRSIHLSNKDTIFKMIQVLRSNFQNKVDPKFNQIAYYRDRLSNAKINLMAPNQFTFKNPYMHYNDNTVRNSSNV